MKVALFTGTALRHMYYAASIARASDVVLHVKTTRAQELTDEIRDTAFDENDRALLKAHSELRTAKEREYFLPLAEQMPSVARSFEIAMSELNTARVADAVRESKPDVVLVYGTGLLRSELLSTMPKWVINFHAGLSPYFRGAATLYWPIYFMKPQEVGYTLHLIDEKIDHGHIIHQNRPEIRANDTIHDLGCRTITTAAADVVQLLPKIEKGVVQLQEPKSEGRVFYERDFKPYHLRVTNYLMKNGLLGEYLAHRVLFPEPTMIQQP